MRKLILLFALLFTAPVMAANTPPLRSAGELEALVGPIALYPDDLVAVVLPAAAYPLQLVQAERAVDDGDRPEADWDEAVVAVMNYPEVLEFLNEDLDWTYELGLAFINQEADVFDAVQAFRADALAAGNLRSDQYQTVSVERGIITITQRDVEKIYIPYYEPREVIVRHVRPVYHYYPVARPVYYYPYPARYSFNVGHFYGVGTYFSIGWHYRGLSLTYSTHSGHPYWGVSYSPRHYYFKPRVRPRLQARHVHHYKPAYYQPVRHKYRAKKQRVTHRKAAHRVAYREPVRYKAPKKRVAKREHRRADNRQARQAQTRQAAARAERYSPQQSRPVSRTEKVINRANKQAQRRMNTRQVSGKRMGASRSGNRADNRPGNNRGNGMRRGNGQR